MAYDKVIDSSLYTNRMVEIADALREKCVLNREIDIDEMPDLIRGITTTVELDPLTFTARQANSTIKITAIGTPVVSGIQYKTKIGNTDSGWKSYTIDSIITLISATDSIQFKNTELNLSTSGTSYVKFVMTGAIDASGDCMSMLNANSETKTMTRGCFFHLFEDCSSLYSAPLLPSTKMSQSCYDSMFKNCTNLVNPPALPAEIMALGCYASMFSGCTSLVVAPTLPATVLADSCYRFMFNGCTSLTTAPALPANTMANNCYNNMFANCTQLQTIPSISATSGALGCFSGMFINCTSLTSVVVPNISLATDCFDYMFKGCTNLNDIACLFTSWGYSTDSDYTNGWVLGVATSGVFRKSEELADIRGVSNIPTGWTVTGLTGVVDPAIIDAEKRASEALLNLYDLEALVTIQYNLANDIIGEQ